MTSNDGKRVLVTGGTGLVGKSIEYNVDRNRSFKENSIYRFLSSNDVDLIDYSNTLKLFKEFRPTHVIHLAAKVGGLYANMAGNLDFFRINMTINDNVLRACHESDVQHCISCLSTCIYPDNTTYPIDETMIHNGEPHSSNFGYSYAKRMLTILARGYNTQYGRNYTTIIPCNIFGPNDNFNIQNGHVLPGLIHKLYLAKKNDDNFIVWGTGKPLRQFIYSRDLANLILWCLDNYKENEPLILAVDEKDEISIKDAAVTIAKAMKYEKDLQFDTTKSDGQFKKTANNGKLRKLFPSFKFTPFEEAIDETVKWFKDNYDMARK
ncbi:hypothetical protein SNEBB_003793 [Seison nebaliae]|nr:hypothetical protein SNEBB_003793 [Seison nebaliae]